MDRWGKAIFIVSTIIYDDVITKQLYDKMESDNLDGYIIFLSIKKTLDREILPMRYDCFREGNELWSTRGEFLVGTDTEYIFVCLIEDIEDDEVEEES